MDLSLNIGVHTVADALAAALELIVRASDPTSNILDFLCGREMLLVLDSCETRIGDAAALAESIIQAAPGVAVLATSRESLRAQSEHVYPLEPFSSPPEGVIATASDLLIFPAVQLFCERAVAAGYRAELKDADAVIVANICRRVDGNALALELAASRVSTYGLRQTADLLDSHMKLTWRGRRTAPPRHQTLTAMLDWSYALITERERDVLRQLSVFVGGFGLDEARGVAGEGDEAIEALEQLVLKSLVAVDTSGEGTRYRLLDTTRAYASAKLLEAGSAREASAPSRAYYLDWLSRSTNVAAAAVEHVSNIRAALEWAFSNDGDAETGLGLATHACELFLRLGMLTESRRCSERALGALPPELAGSHRDMALRAALAFALMFTGGGLTWCEDPSRTRSAWRNGWASERISSGCSAACTCTTAASVRLTNCCRPRGVQRRSYPRSVERRKSPRKRCSAFQITSRAISTRLMQRWRRCAPCRSIQAACSISMACTGKRDAMIAGTLWLRGFPDQAAQAAPSVATINVGKDPVTACLCLMWSAIAFHLRGDWAIAEEYLDRMVRVASDHALAPYKWLGMGIGGDLKVQRGEAEEGMSDLWESLRRLQEGGFVTFTSWLTCCLAEALASRHKLDQAQSLINALIPLRDLAPTFTCLSICASGAPSWPRRATWRRRARVATVH